MKNIWLLASGLIVLVAMAACSSTDSPLPTSATLDQPLDGDTQDVPAAGTMATPKPYVYSPETYESKLTSCGTDANKSTIRVRPTIRRFITIPRAIYPDGHFANVEGTAEAGYISNGGLPGWAIGGSPDCWATYYEFSGFGEIDFLAESVLPGAPDYEIHFIVER